MTEPLVALPGTLCPPEIFAPMARRVGGLIELDARDWLAGRGPRDIPSVAATIAADVRRRYGRPVLVCGHSTGGAIALQLALTAPEAVAGLLLVNTGAHMRGHGDVETILRRIREQWGEPLRAVVLDRSFHFPPDAAGRARMLTWSATVRQQAVHDVLASQRALDLSSRLPEITVPTVVLHGVYDRARSVAQARELAAAIPDARLRLVHAEHTPVYEAPDAAARAVSEVLQAVRSGSWPA